MTKDDATVDKFVTALVRYILAEQSCLLFEDEFAEVESVGCNFGEKEDIGGFGGVIDFIVL